MSPSDLRIGNKVIANWSTGDWTSHTVTAEDFGKSAAGTLICESFRPEPITEEWLVRFGFAQFSEPMYSSGKSFKISIGDKVSLESCPTHSGGVAVLCLCAGNYFANNIHFVHDLQNLYRALTGHELILTSTVSTTT